MQPGQAEFDREGYRSFWSSAEKKGYSGTAVFSRPEPLSVAYGIGGSGETPGKYSDEGRLITLDYGDFYLINSYTPNVQRELTRMDYRMGFEDTGVSKLWRYSASWVSKGTSFLRQMNSIKKCASSMPTRATQCLPCRLRGNAI